MSVLTETLPPVLNAQTLCDSCRSRAYVVVILRWSPTLRNGGELLFCGHCYHKNEHALQPHIAQLIDERTQLTKHATDDGGPR
jgi:hypothetical protein